MTPSWTAFSPPLAVQPNAEGWTNPLNGLILSVAFIVSALGIAVIIWGAYCSVLRLVASESAVARGQAPKSDTLSVRLLFASYLLPGLDFMLAGSVIKTAAAADWQQVTVVGGIVLVRTLFSLSTSWESKALVALKDVPATPERLVAPADSAENLNPTTEASASVSTHTVP
jgi:uncharacterized membrane protein